MPLHMADRVGFVKITLAYCDDDKIECLVEDNGIGIAPENLDKIWQRFYQVDLARGKEGTNSGLGLFMVKWIVEKYSGNIQVESKLGYGSTFVLKLPK